MIAKAESELSDTSVITEIVMEWHCTSCLHGGFYAIEPKILELINMIPYERPDEFSCVLHLSVAEYDSLKGYYDVFR